MTAADLLDFIGAHGLLLVFPIAIFEGPIIATIMGYFVKQGVFGFWGAFAVLVLADLAGDTVVYGIGRYGRAGLSRKMMSRLRIDAKRLLELKQQYKTRGAEILIWGKLLHAPGMVVLLAAGAARMNFVIFLVSNLIATLPKTLLFVALGYFVAGIIGKLEGYLFNYSLIAMALIVAAGLIWWRYGRKKHDK